VRLGPLRDASGKPKEIDDVWALQFGADTGPHTAHNQLFSLQVRTGMPMPYMRDHARAIAELLAKSPAPQSF
jgi:hypothetical protein